MACFPGPSDKDFRVTLEETGSSRYAENKFGGKKIGGKNANVQSHRSRRSIKRRAAFLSGIVEREREKF
jgi:hypothetical protein